MKKILGLLTSFILILFMMSGLASFSGINGSLNFGILSSNVSDNLSLNIFIPGIESVRLFSSPRAGITTLDGGVRVGYGNVFVQKFLLGIAVDANFEDNSVSFNSTGIERNQHLYIPTHSTVQLKNQLALLLKFGGLLGSRALFYGLIGPQWGDFSLSTAASYKQGFGVGAVPTSAVQGNRNFYNTGVLVGVGAEELLTHYMSLGIEYTYTFYRQLSFFNNLSNPIILNGTPFPGSSFSNTNNFNAKVSNIMLRLGFYFSS